VSQTSRLMSQGLFLFGFGTFGTDSLLAAGGITTRQVRAYPMSSLNSSRLSGAQPA